MSKNKLGEIVTIYPVEKEEPPKKAVRKLDYAVGILAEYGNNDWVVFNNNGRGYCFVDKSIDTSKFETNQVVYYYTDKSTIKNEIDTRIFEDHKGEFRAFVVDKKKVKKKVFSIDWAFNQLWIIGERNSFKFEIIRKQVAEMFEEEIKKAYEQGHKDSVKNKKYFTETYGDDFNKSSWR